uniref:Amine oxidase n=1 Tax=Timema poppense TaxID=170557 RepID=A0A7R9CZU0_TIMPO|nr:unnamed protein product [Timema poppensis]
MLSWNPTVGYNGLVTCNDDIEVVGLAAEDFKPGVQLAGMICFMYGDQALRMANKTEEERKKKVCQTLSNFFKTHAALKVVGLAAEDFKPGVQLAGMICFVYGDQALRMANMTEEERKKKVCQALSNFFKTHAALKPVHYMDKIWSQDTYVGGGYTCYYPPGVLSKYGPAIRESIGGCIFLAGSETALQWTGYMSGAVEAGERACT